MKTILSLYNALWIFAVPFLLPLLMLMRWAKGEKSSSMRERIAVPSGVSCKDSIVWCHAISVGELNALFPVACAIKEHDPSWPLVITTQTVAGLKMARKRFPFARGVLYAPLDHPWMVKRFMRRFRVSVLLVMETGYWPNMLSQARSQGALVILAQARMSEKSFHLWSQFHEVSRWLLRFFHCITVEDSSIYHRFAALGVDKERLRILPNTKYDTVETIPEEKRSQLRQKLGVGRDHLILVAGSTHPGEERELLEAYVLLRSVHQRMLLILAPRRQERVEQVRRELAKYHLSWQNWTDLSTAARSSNVIVLDTMGELAELYSIATVAFVGNSLFSPGGGHSLIEPAAQGVPILHGPYIPNCSVHADQLGRLGAARVVRNARDIANQVNHIIGYPQESRTATLRAQQWIHSQRGASDKLAELVLSNLHSGTSAA